MVQFEVGALVRSLSNPDWGLGQVQSNIGDKITINFEHAGKMVLTGDAINLTLISPDWS